MEVLEFGMRMYGAVLNECKLGKEEMDFSEVLMLVIDLIEFSLKNNYAKTESHGLMDLLEFHT